MKTYIGPRDKSGATLGLVAFVVLIIIAIGVFVYFGGRLISGNHQLNMSTDAGILNVAHQALLYPGVALDDPTLPKQGTLPYQQFGVWADGHSSLTFDQGGQSVTVQKPFITARQIPALAGQVILTLLNASVINTTAASSNAADVFSAFLNLEQKIRQLQTTNTVMNPYFDSIAGQNNLNMLGQQASVSRNGDVQGGFYGLGQKFPTALFFDNNIITGLFDSKNYYLPVADGANTVTPDYTNSKNIDCYDPNCATPANYIQGYKKLRVTVGSTDYTFMLAPAFPKSLPHLEDVNRVTTLATMPADDYVVLPNAFYVGTNANAAMLGTTKNNQGSSQSNSTNVGPQGGGSSNNLYVHSVSCAIEGTGGPGYIGCIPAGFIRVLNGQDMQAVVGQNIPSNDVVDASNLIVNTYMLAPTNYIYVGMPLPLNSDGTLNKSKVVFATDSNGLTVLTNQINFNNSRVTTADDVVNGQYRDKTKDTMNTSITPKGASKPVTNLTPWWLTNYPAQTVSKYLYEGSTSGNHATVADVQNMTGYMAWSDLTFDGTNNVVYTDPQKKTVSYGPSVVQAAIDTFASNLGVDSVSGNGVGTGGGGKFAFNAANGYTNNTAYTASEYYKAWLISTFITNKPKGVESVTFSTGTSGMGAFNWYDPSTGKQVAISVPNNYLARKDPGTAAASKEIPHVCQFETVGTPYSYLMQIDSIIKQNGGYKDGQMTMSQYLDKLLLICREINPAWTADDLKNALNDTNVAMLPVGATLYIHRNLSTGALVCDNNLSYDKGYGADGAGSKATMNFAVQTDQAIPLNHYIINTAAWGLPDAYKADCNVEAEIWRSSSGNVYAAQGSTFVPSSGYYNLLGELNFFEQLSGGTINFSNPN